MEYGSDPSANMASTPAAPGAAWEEFPLLRETALLYVSDPWLNGALRVTGELLFSLLLEVQSEGPTPPESATRLELRAAAADLRHLEGFLASVGRERETCSLSIADARLSRFAAGTAQALGKIAASIERQLAQEAVA